MRKIYFTLLLTLFIFSFTPAHAASNLEEGVSQLAQQISKSMQEKQKQKIAIIDFSDYKLFFRHILVRLGNCISSMIDKKFINPAWRPLLA